LHFYTGKGSDKLDVRNKTHNTSIKTQEEGNERMKDEKFCFAPHGSRFAPSLDHRFTSPNSLFTHHDSPLPTND